MALDHNFGCKTTLNQIRAKVAHITLTMCVIRSQRAYTAHLTHFEIYEPYTRDLA